MAGFSLVSSSQFLGTQDSFVASVTNCLFVQLRTKFSRSTTPALGMEYTSGSLLNNLFFLEVYIKLQVVAVFLFISLMRSKQQDPHLLQPGWPSFMVATPTSSPRILSWPFKWDAGHQGCRLLLAHHQGSLREDLPNKNCTSNLKCSAQATIQKGKFKFVTSLFVVSTARASLVSITIISNPSYIG